MPADLDDLRDGTVLLTVPLLDNAIQIGIGGRYPTATIAVSKSATTVHVWLTDGRPMQVHIVHDWQDTARPGTRTAVFDDPVDHLTLERCDAGWRPTACAYRREDLEQFVHTIVRFALAKQHKADQRAA